MKLAVTIKIFEQEFVKHVEIPDKDFEDMTFEQVDSIAKQTMEKMFTWDWDAIGLRKEG